MRRPFVPQRKAGAPSSAQQLPAAAAAAPPPLAVFDCTFTPQHKKRGATSDGTLVLTGSRAQLFDLRLREVAAGVLPAAAAAALHAAHAAVLAALAAGQPLGPLWPAGGDVEPPAVVLTQFAVDIDDDRSAAVRPEDWELRQAVAASQGHNGKPKGASGPPIPADSLGARMLASLGWVPGQGLGQQPGVGRTAPVLPVLKHDKGGLGSLAHVKRLGAQHTAFRRAAAGGAAGGGIAAGAAEACGS
ncbi:angiogenic factor with G patch and FHA domains 1 isoform X1 [Chlorella sorokiniana]|uniref:Angiogenic factor with G patch and FHA domains 1 isoform X1 n=1 Tax=Chlorella sorokiniana TaxID=3076 RepID=A0A2P6U007_CHLSO|nr:angiogenic factor with G patch and FHA domains 1 isoform X1 [Chlorella sorokiniana]|eukprot:PRW59654.1 angiogenic factor with G patch and FHA domains 1 isoform X1 [Chlorella sorokiniana]